ncbi:hypothetical protein ADEAN_000695000 [Angomonas deanei]|uniref:Uncharacterized protein n=1 Tax=Angomonas deanei TaxID=59799 RepID=A0A7G2CJ89_9TRYP|nr:hypothetical protein ADEAN_000695000 [Angomonas deanei]
MEAELRSTSDQLTDEVASLEMSLAAAEREVQQRDQLLKAAQDCMSQQYDASLEGLTTLQHKAMEEIGEQQAVALETVAQTYQDEIERLKELYDLVDDEARENAMRFAMLRQVLGKIDQDVKQATTVTERKTTNLRSARGTQRKTEGSPSRLGSLSTNTPVAKTLEFEKENSMPRSVSRTEEY